MAEMNYSEFVEVYNLIAATTKRLEKEAILAAFLKKIQEKGKSEWIYLLKGKVFPDYDSREFGISTQLTIKAIGFAFGIKEEKIVERFRKIGDLGKIAEEFAEKKKQTTLFSTKLSVAKVYSNLQKLVSIEGKGTVDKKIDLVAEILGSATNGEAKYIVRTLLGELRVGIADGIIRDAIASAFFAPERRMEMSDKIGSAYDLANDFAVVLDAAAKGEDALEDIEIVPGKPLNVMLAPKVASIEEGFEVCGKPAAVELKYDGFRMLIHKKGKDIMLFTRRLENVTRQFPDVVAAVRENVEGKDFILDSEVVGYAPSSRKYRPFESISQRIKRKYDIDKLVKELPVEVNVFDVLYFDGKSRMKESFIERRKLLERIVAKKPWAIQPARQIITDKAEEAMQFYEDAVKMGEEGVMIKKLDAPYQQGRRVGFMVKLKPMLNDLDLVIVGAEYGSGKRGGWLTSYIVACESDGELLEVGKVSSGLKEKEEFATEASITFDEMTDLLRPLITAEGGNMVRVKPKIVVSVNYQNIQQSPSYASGYALRFPRITAYRPDRSTKDIATLEDIEREFKRMQRAAQNDFYREF